MRKRVALVDGHGVRHTITRIHDTTRRTTRGVQRQHSLDLHVHGGHVERLEHDLGHALSVGLGVQRSLGEQHGVLFGSHTQLVVEGVVPDLLHIIPVGDDAVLDGVLQRQHTSLGLSLVAHEVILVLHTDHVHGVLGTTDDGGEDSARSIISSKTGLAHTGTVIDHNTLDFSHSNVFLCVDYKKL